MTKLHYLAYIGCLLLISCSAINEKMGWTVEEELEIAEEIVEVGAKIAPLL